MRHIVWDWNGTLFDDQHLVVAAVNAVMADQGVEPISLADLQRHYTRPVSLFYERLLGRPIDPSEWPHLDDVYHDAYLAQVESVGLVDGADEVIGTLDDLGRTQSLLSMWRHHQLVPTVQRLGLHERFVRVDGLRGPGGGHKAEHLEAHLRELVAVAGDDPSQVLVVGDALDDAAAAAHVGARAVLFDGGSHDADELRRTGVPVIDHLRGLVDLLAS